MTEVGEPSAAAVGGSRSEGRRIVLQHTARLRITLVEVDGGRPEIHKESLGPNAVARAAHEAAMLLRLAGVPGVPNPLRPPAGALLAFPATAGDPLSELIGPAGPTSPAELADLLDLAVNLADLLARVHERGVVHQDLNPASILIRAADRTPMLIDFDLAGTVVDEQPGRAASTSISGTLAYLAPEQTGRTGQVPDQRTDLYSLGVTLYELATGGPPFGRGEDDPLALIHDHLARVPVPAAELNPLLPAGLSDVIGRLMEKEPARRYQSAAGLGHDLRRLRDEPADTDFRLGLRDFPLRLAAPPELIAREPQLAALIDAFEAACAGAAGGILVAGGAGVGKTALIDQLRPVVTAAGGWFVYGQFDERNHDQRSDAVTRALRGLGRMLLAEPDGVLAGYREQLLIALGDKAPMAAALIPEFELLLGVRPERPTGDPLQIQSRVFRAGLDILRVTASPARPVVIVLDDLQWATAFPLGLIDTVLTDDDLSGLLLVGAYRDGEIGEDHPLRSLSARWQGLGRAPARIELTDLVPADLATMVRKMLRLAPDEAARLAAAVGDRTGGNPYETVELLNALRAEGALTLTGNGWSWDAGRIRRHVGAGDVGTQLLRSRIDRLPEPTAAVLETMACLSGVVDLDLLAAATALPAAELRDRLGPASEDDLLTLTSTGSTEGTGGGQTVSFRHERARRAARTRLSPATLQSLQLRIARRLATGPGQNAEAAEQYLAALDAVTDPAERRQVAIVFQRAAATMAVTNPTARERFLRSAGLLIIGLGTAEDSRLLLELEIQRHATLYGLGQFAQMDELYQSITRRCPDPLAEVEAAGVQIAGLTNQNRPQEAVALGLRLLGRLGLAIPAADRLAGEVDRGLDQLYRWVDADDQAGDLARPEVLDPTVNAIASIINRMMPPSFFGDQNVLAWLVLESARLWAEHGPCRALVGPINHAAVVAIGARQDHRIGYRVAKRVLATSGERGYEPETSHARFLFSVSSAHWFESLEECLLQAQRAREGLLRGGDPQTAVFTYHTTTPSLLDCAPTLEQYVGPVEAGLALAARTGNDQTVEAAVPYRQLVRALRGETRGRGGFSDETFDEATYVAGLPANPMAAANYHITRALSAALFGDHGELAVQARAALPWLPYIQGSYTVSRAHLLQALALAEAARNATGEPERAVLIEQFDVHRAWLAGRAADSAGNFGHLLAFVDAERAWAVGDFRSTMGGFDAAMQDAVRPEVGGRRPWHKALITERAALFHLAHGHQHAAHSLLGQARDSYAAWGASAKVARMHELYPFLRTARPLTGPGPVAGPAGPGDALLDVSSEAVDLMAVLRASQALGSETEIDRLRGRAVEVLTAMTGATAVRVLLRNQNDDGWMLPGAAGTEPTAVGPDSAGLAGLLPLSAFRYAERTRKPLVVSDATRDDRFAADPYFAEVRCCSLLVVPILSQGAPRVMLVLENQLHHSVFSPDRLDAILLIAGQLAASFDNAQAQSLREREAERRLRLLETLRQRERLLETLLAIQRDISHRAPLQTVLDAVTSGASAMPDGDFVALVLIDPLDGRPGIPSVCGRRSGPDADELVLSLATEAIARDQLVTGSGAADTLAGGLIAAPVHASGEIIGSLVTVGLVTDGARTDRQSERLDLLAAFAEQVSLALNDANTLQAIREASYDSLTGLASRPLFLDRLNRALAGGEPDRGRLTVLFIDLDRFKAVNDSLGHGAGDELLAEVAGRLRNCIRDADTAARLGGDEFAVLLENTLDTGAGLRAAAQITAAMELPFRIAGKDIFVTASIGVAHGGTGDLAATELLGQADIAMYRAKQAGSRRAVVFEPQMHEEATERLELQGDLQRALVACEFRLQFQPLLALDSGRPVGMEALLRWEHPERGPISPAVFVPLAEETGAIVELGRWVLTESCAQVAAWRRTMWPDLELSINVSVRQLIDDSLAADVAATLARTGLPARALTLELTESVLMDDSGSILQRLAELKQLGVQLAIDDFGTGYSSLSYLRRFPVDKLKIDKSFIDSIAVLDEDLAIVRTVVDLAQILQLQTTAEGIETQEQADLLRNLGCEIGQGYLFARPLEAADVPGYLAGHPSAGRPVAGRSVAGGPVIPAARR